MKNLRWLALGMLAFVAVGGSVWWCWGRSPKAQVLAAQDQLLRALERRDFTELHGWLAEDYADDYGFDREQLTASAKRLLSGFFTLTIHEELDVVQAVPDLGMVKVRLRLEGNGSGFSQVVVNRANQARSPWFFHWHKRGRWPWSWRVVQIHNDDLP